MLFLTGWTKGPTSFWQGGQRVPHHFDRVDKGSHIILAGWTKGPTSFWQGGQRVPYWWAILVFVIRWQTFKVLSTFTSYWIYAILSTLSKWCGSFCPPCQNDVGVFVHPVKMMWELLSMGAFVRLPVNTSFATTFLTPFISYTFFYRGIQSVCPECTLSRLLRIY